MEENIRLPLGFSMVHVTEHGWQLVVVEEPPCELGARMTLQEFADRYLIPALVNLRQLKNRAGDAGDPPMKEPQ